MVLALGILPLLGLLLMVVPQGPWAAAGRAGDLVFQLPTAQYETENPHGPGSIGPLFNMTRLFIRMVLPHAFPEDTLRQVIQKKFDFSSERKSIIVFELGIIICATLGLLFVILMPLVGFCFGLCRCCNKCGGEMHQRQKRNGPFLRKYFAVSLLLLCILISFGIICGFAANQHQMIGIGRSRKLAESNFRDLRTLVNTTPEQIKYIMGQYNTTKQRAFSDLDDIKSVLGGSILEKLKPKVVPVLDNIQDFAEAIRTTRDTLVQVNSTLGELKALTSQLDTSLRDVKNSLEQAIRDPECTGGPVASTCNSVQSSLSQLEVEPQLDQLPSLDQEINSVNNVLQVDLSSLVQKGNESFNDIPQKVEEQAASIVSDTKKTLNSIGSRIDNARDQIHIEEKLVDIKNSINTSESYINKHLPLLEKYDSYRWLGNLLICSLLTLIMVFYILGLLCGTCGYNKRATPTRRGCVSNTGGVFLMVGVGISFLFCWIFMAYVVVTFVIGGNMEKLVCEPYHNRKLFRVLDTPYLLNENWKFYLSGLILNKPDLNLTLEQVYSDCKENKSIYSTLKLENIYNVSKELNGQEHIKNIHDELDKLNVNVGPITLLDDEGRQNLKDFSQSGVDKIDYDSLLAETGKAPMKTDLVSFAYDLEDKANQLPEGTLKNSLKSSAQTMRRIHQDQVKPLGQKMSSLHQTTKALQQEVRDLEAKVNHVLSDLNSTEDFLTNNISTVITNEVQSYGKMIISHFELYLEWVEASITQKVAACKPFATALDSAVQVFLCSYVVDPMNLFWFGIGKATYLLLPALIFAVKLAKYYRRMDSEDVYDDVENTPVKNISFSASPPSTSVSKMTAGLSSETEQRGTLGESTLMLDKLEPPPVPYEER